MARFILTKNYYRKLARIEKALYDAGLKTLDQLGSIGLNYAKGKAPHDSGKTAKAIRRINSGTAKSPEITIISPNMYPHESKSPKVKGTFNLPRWMHTSPNAKEHIKTGDRRYMYRTAEYLRRIASKTAKGHFNKIKIK